MTMDCELRRLRSGFKGRRERHTHAEIYHVLEGTGTTRIGDRNIDWTQGDTFVVPLWTWHDHENRSQSSATLLTVSDKPVMQALGFDRHEIDR
jgi:gentisate 1,2-dioxygenase